MASKHFLLSNLINAKDASYEARAMKAPQSKPRTRKNEKRKSSNQTFQASKGTKTPKATPW